MGDHDRGQVTGSAAEVYEAFFVPALFAPWAPRLADAALIQEGDEVLDVACGTGVLAREAAKRAGAAGRVVGLDVNPGMLDVARSRSREIEWRVGRAEELPFEDGDFDAVLSQFGLMFFDDRVAALREMWRALRSGGRLAVAVWDAIDRSPGYAAMAALLERLFGRDVARALHAPFALGDLDALTTLFLAAGIRGAQIDTIEDEARFPSLASWLFTDVRGWTLADAIDDAQFERLSREAARELARFVGPDGSVRFTAPALVVRATKGGGD